MGDGLRGTARSLLHKSSYPMFNGLHTVPGLGRCVWSCHIDVYSHESEKWMHGSFLFPCTGCAGYGADGRQFSLLEYMLWETEQTHCKVRRYTSPDEHPFFPNDLPPLILPPIQYEQARPMPMKAPLLHSPAFVFPMKSSVHASRIPCMLYHLVQHPLWLFQSAHECIRLSSLSKACELVVSTSACTPVLVRLVTDVLVGCTGAGASRARDQY